MEKGDLEKGDLKQAFDTILNGPDLQAQTLQAGAGTIKQALGLDTVNPNADQKAAPSAGTSGPSTPTFN